MWTLLLSMMQLTSNEGGRNPGVVRLLLQMQPTHVKTLFGGTIPLKSFGRLLAAMTQVSLFVGRESLTVLFPTTRCGCWTDFLAAERF